MKRILSVLLCAALLIAGLSSHVLAANWNVPADGSLELGLSQAGPTDTITISSDLALGTSGLEIPAGVTVKIEDGVTVTGDIVVNGELDNSGTIAGDTTVNNQFVNRGKADDVTVAGNGTLTNGGTVADVTNDGIVTNQGKGQIDSLTNNGIAFNMAGGNIDKVENNNSLANDAASTIDELVNNGYAVNGGTINTAINNDELYNAAWDANGNFSAGGTIGDLTNAAGSYIFNYGDVTGTIVNDGEFFGATGSKPEQAGGDFVYANKTLNLQFIDDATGKVMAVPFDVSVLHENGMWGLDKSFTSADLANWNGWFQLKNSAYGEQTITVIVNGTTHTYKVDFTKDYQSFVIRVGSSEAPKETGGSKTSSGGSSGSSGSTGGSGTRSALPSVLRVSAETDTVDWDGGNLRITIPSPANKLNFTGVSVRGNNGPWEAIPSEYLSVRSGSAIVTIDEEFLETLPRGSYSLRYEFLTFNSEVKLNIRNTGSRSSDDGERSSSRNTNTNPGTGR